jgi:EAL domain-containing protein (putative c-di-GMP-specific phosphodiesterase class I)/DNA-binding NarL/FixJ family response regulator
MKTPPICNEQLILEEGLAGAERRGELHLLYQPQVDMTSGEIVAVEALLRWEHPSLGQVAPSVFIPLAERLGLMDAIGRWVLETACDAASRWQRAGPTPVRINVNLSARELLQPDFPETIAQLLDKHALDPSCFGIEITEHGLAGHIDEAAAQLARLQAMGVGVALDDFGTGQSSLTCLRRLPVDVVKIDRSFIGELTSNADALAITHAVIAMAHSLGKLVLAEGVENSGQLELLAANGCDLFQGFYFSLPVPAAQISHMLADRRKLQAASRRSASETRTVMIVDGDRWALDKLRQQIGWRHRDTVRVETFDDSASALRRLSAGPVDVVICALRMGDSEELDGLATLADARAIQPNATRMMLLGSVDMGRVMREDRQVDVFRYVSKPWILDQFLNHLEAALREAERAGREHLHSEATRLAQYAPSRIAALLPRRADARRGIGAVDRGPMGEVLMPHALLTLPGDLWTVGRNHVPYRAP